MSRLIPPNSSSADDATNPPSMTKGADSDGADALVVRLAEEFGATAGTLVRVARLFREVRERAPDLFIDAAGALGPALTSTEVSGGAELTPLYSALCEWARDAREEPLERMRRDCLRLQDVMARGMLRLYAGDPGQCTENLLALQRFGSAAQGDPLHRAAEHLGRLLRTVFLCDYIAIEDFRREIHTLLNRGESVHQLQRAVYSGKVAPERGRRRDEMKAISGSHALLTNIVLAWNTARMHEVVERLKRDGIAVEDDWLRRMGPAHFSHINFRGTMRFGVEKFAAALIQRMPGQATRSGS